MGSAWTSTDVRLAVAFLRLRHRRGGRHRSSEPRAVAAWVWTVLTVAYVVACWRMAVIGMPWAVAVAAVCAAVLAFAAGHAARGERR